MLSATAVFLSNPLKFRFNLSSTATFVLQSALLFRQYENKPIQI